MTEEVQKPELTEAEIEARNAEMMTAYNKLLSDVLVACNGNNPQVAVAAVISAAACILVDHTPNPEAAKGYFMRATTDALMKFDGAFEIKNKPLDELIEETGATPAEGAANGSGDAGERREEANT